jgi:hypothetical protein
MSYAQEDLTAFVPLLNPAEREGTSYFEFHPRELPAEYACWLEGSLLLRDAAFDFFAECFHTASESFDYFAFERFRQPEIDKLLSALDSFLSQLDGTPTREQVFACYASLFSQDIWGDIDTQDLATSVRACGETLRAFIRTETAATKCLWVLGM